MKNRLLNKVCGSLVGGAVGDALGYVVEFATADDIHRRFGEEGITQYVLNREGVAEISDDTQMTMFVTESMLWERRCGVALTSEELDRLALLAWYHTQTGAYGRPYNNMELSRFKLLKVSELYHRRAPGMTCMSACGAMMSGLEVVNDSKGCGGIMRVAPLALSNALEQRKNMDELLERAKQMVYLTHQHPLGYGAAMLQTYVLAHILQWEGDAEAFDWRNVVYEGLKKVRESLPEADFMTLYQLVNLAFYLAQRDMEDEKAIAQLGEGWVAEETFAIALYCCVKYSTCFAKAIVAAVNHSGDSDSTGAVAGHLLGALLGRKAIPAIYTDKLELVSILEILAADLCLGNG